MLVGEIDSRTTTFSQEHKKNIGCSIFAQTSELFSDNTINIILIIVEGTPIV